MKTVRHILQEKGNAVWATSPDAPVFEALQLMAEKDIGALLVLEAGKPVGIFSERDYARRVILKGKASKNTPVKEIMTSPVIFVRPQHTVSQCMALMARRRIRHLPVIEDNQVVGVISIGDVVQAYITEQAEELARLEQALRGVELFE